ncbi:MAG TPA: uracil-DNA glycosylase, partial [Dehalococcoidia bacterium]|nr:uracil-DNA glycosylase [Dehalococcoidia bacterium]
MVSKHEKELGALTREIVACRVCSRLVDWREKIGDQKRASYKDWDYWAKPVPSFG